MAREIVQMYDKYHSTKKVYPKVIEECLPEDYQGLPKTVENIPTVVANPELAGTEGDLESLQVGDTKYKIGGGKQLYQHNINIFDNVNGVDASLQILSSNPNEMTFADVCKWINENGFNYTSPKYRSYLANGNVYHSSSYYNIVYCYTQYDSSLTLYAQLQGSSTKYGFGITSPSFFVDTVVAL